MEWPVLITFTYKDVQAPSNLFVLQEILGSAGDEARRLMPRTMEAMAPGSGTGRMAHWHVDRLLGRTTDVTPAAR